MAWLVGVLWLLLGATGHAQAPACAPDDTVCRCDGDWGCWDMLLRTEGTVLGLKGSLSQVDGVDESLDGALLTSYFTEHYGTRDGLSGHFAAAGAIGGGSAGTEGGASAALDFGYRLAVTATGGPFLRAGVSGLYLGHARLTLASFEPLQVRLGYQLLDRGRLFEWAVTGGATLRGSFDVGDGTARALDPSPQFGSYLALWLGPLRAGGGLTRILAQHLGDPAPVTLLRGTLCGYVESIAVCGEFTHAYGTTLDAARQPVSGRAFYGGLILGLTP